MREDGSKMREILFRGKRTDNGEWVEGFYARLGSKDNYDYILTEKSSMSVFGLSYSVNPETVGQYTGLIVANGKVFDGDIIKFGRNLCLVFWNEEAFQWQAKRIDADLEIYRTYVDCRDSDWTITDLGWIAAEPIIIGKMTTEIVGNIYDNPELLSKDIEKNRKSREKEF